MNDTIALGTHVDGSVFSDTARHMLKGPKWPRHVLLLLFIHMVYGQEGNSVNTAPSTLLTKNRAVQNIIQHTLCYGLSLLEHILHVIS